VARELAQLARAVEEQAVFRSLVATPLKSREEKKEAFDRVAEAMDLCAQTRRLLRYLADRKRTAILPALAESFSREVDRRLGVRRARLVSAAPLTEEQKRMIVDRLKQITGARVEVEQQVDDSLIAGFQVRLDGKFYDGSLRGRLRKLKERIAHAT
jgi:F-type H+-transporting ATPase subunit delta